MSQCSCALDPNQVWAAFARWIRIACRIVACHIVLFAAVAAAAQSSPLDAAAFVKQDTVTQGNWRGKYGTSGYSIEASSAALPSGVQLTATGDKLCTWDKSDPHDVRSLLKPTSTTDRIAACWYASKTFTIDLRFPDDIVHQVSLYALDYDIRNRSERIDVFDPLTGLVLCSQTVTDFSTTGKYIVWNVACHVQFRITLTGGLNPVLSGIFFDPAPNGLVPAINTGLAYNVSTSLDPTSMTFSLAAAMRAYNSVTVQYHIYDVYKNSVANGQFNLALIQNQPASATIAFTPSAWGWYCCEFQVFDTTGDLRTTIDANIGYTPPYADMPTLPAGESVGGWTDAPRQAFCGLNLERTNTDGGLNAIEPQLQQADQYGTTLLVQFDSVGACAPSMVQAALNQFKGRVKYWEILNEPNGQLTPAAYVNLLKQVVPIIRKSDPTAKILGPTTGDVDVPWITGFYAAGGGPYVDILSVHDYEGNESIDPGHWIWKFSLLRQLMNLNGDSTKQIWLTERAITGVRFNTFLGGAQAVRVTLHADLLDMFGISQDHNMHYYLNDSGYASEPSFLWSATGPLPGALAMRTRYEMTRSSQYGGSLDFGPTGNKIFMGLLYNGSSGTTAIIRNLGATNPNLTLNVIGGSTVQILDSFGNVVNAPVINGQITLGVPALPIYVKLPPGETVEPQPIDFGPNLALNSTITYNDVTNSDMSLLNNGILETQQPSDPHPTMWIGELTQPNPTLEIDLPAVQTVSRIMIYSARADNPYCTLLDFDVETYDGENWNTVQQVRSNMPSSDLVASKDSYVNTWYMDQNINVVQFAPVNTSKVRVVIRRTTYGLEPDLLADEAAATVLNVLQIQQLYLREVEVY